MAKPEEEARKQIDEALMLAGWAVQDAGAVNVDAARGVAIREFPLAKGFGTADYLLYIDGQAAGVLEAKKAGTTLTGVEVSPRSTRPASPTSSPPPFARSPSSTSPPASRRCSRTDWTRSRAVDPSSTSTDPRRSQTGSIERPPVSP